jgi:hypothetical protein
MLKRLGFTLVAIINLSYHHGSETEFFPQIPWLALTFC